MNIQGKIFSTVEGKLRVYEDLVLPVKVVEAVPNGTYFVLKGKRENTILVSKASLLSLVHRIKLFQYLQT